MFREPFNIAKLIIANSQAGLSGRRRPAVQLLQQYPHFATAAYYVVRSFIDLGGVLGRRSRPRISDGCHEKPRRVRRGK